MAETMRNAIVYLTYNGVYNFTNGIGTQTQLLLTGLEHLRDDLQAEFGSIDLHVACPMPDPHTWGYDQPFFDQQRERIAALGGQLHLLPYKTHDEQELWDIRSWRALSQAITPWLLERFVNNDRCLVVCVDQPWLLTPHDVQPSYTSFNKQVQFLMVLYNTAFIRNWHTPDQDEIAWEQQGLSQSKPEHPVFIADVCPSFTAHLKSNFQLTNATFAPYTSSILANHADFAVAQHTDLQAVLQEYNIPLDEDIVLAFGRAAPIKGFDLLISALQSVRTRCHLVLISVPYLNDDAEQRRYDRQIASTRIHATHIKQFTRALPIALSQWPRTKAVVLPSRQETFSNIPLEVGLWARHHGPVVVASRIGGFVDLIEDGMTGFLFKTESSDALTQALHRVFHLSPQDHATIRQRLYQRVVRQHDFKYTFPTILRWFWSR